MSVIDDVRKVAQDFIAPELRGINERLNALEKRVDLLHSDVNTRFADLRAEMARQNDLCGRIFIPLPIGSWKCCR